MITPVGYFPKQKIKFTGNMSQNVNCKTICDEYDSFKRMEFSQSVMLTDVLDEMCANKNRKYDKLYGVGSDKKFIQNLSQALKNSELKDLKIVQIVGVGTSAIAFEQEDGNVIKFAQNHRFNLKRPHESFDVPVLNQGKIGKFRYFVEEKCYTNDLPFEFTEIIREQIIKAGYRCRDIEEGSTHQIGISAKGKLYLLDAECARYKTIFHALFDNVKRFLKR